MKVSELIKEVNKDIYDKLQNGDIIGWLNRALDDLSPVSRYQKSQTISVVADQKDYALPTDMVELVYLVDEKQVFEYPIHDMESSGYKIWGNTLTIQPTPAESKELTLYYYARLPHLTLFDQEAEPVIRSDFHDLLVLYAVAKAKYMDDEESLQVNAWNEYQLRKQQFAAEMMKNDGSVHQVRLVT